MLAMGIAFLKFPQQVVGDGGKFYAGNAGETPVSVRLVWCPDDVGI